MTAALTCARCGAPLPIEAGRSHVVACAYCEATLLVDGARVALQSDAPAIHRAHAPTASQAFMQEVAQSVSGGGDPYTTLRDASARHVGVAGQSDAVARVTLGIAREFGAEHRLSIERDGGALSRIAEGYLKAVAALRTSASTELSLPFLAADANGPKHLTRTLDPTTIARLATTDPVAKKTGWWPFS